ncbi:MAG: selenium cofactor biosynthesis protein YqeC [Pseudomonadota bacterium]
MNDLLRACRAERGTVAFVGAGGKKSAMYSFASAHTGRVLLSSTSHMYRYDEGQVDVIVEAGSLRLDRIPTRGRVVAVAGKTDTPERVGGIDDELIGELWRSGQFEALYIKADGARARWIKAPAEHEPLVPSIADVVIPLVSIKVLGRELASGIAHREKELSAVTGCAYDEPLTEHHLARLLVHEDGALRGIPQRAAVVPLINMVDDDEYRTHARSVAQMALAATTRFERVVLARLKDSELVEIVS